ncbi:MAG: 30S ribosome-binding factor RbfA [Parcubacteria group bacterium]|nr:30S ribosome-binding factor RbfA [Parcubacteria group bacterium]
MSRRIEKVNELLKEVIADIVLREVQFSGGALVTVTRVNASSDLHYADVFVTIFGKDREAQREALLLLKKSTRGVQQRLNRKLRMRPVPRILFLTDEEEERRERVEELLARDRQSG